MSSAADQPSNGPEIAARSKFSLWGFDIQSCRVGLSFLPFFPPHNRDGDVIPVIPRIRSGNAQRLPQLVIVRPAQRVPNQVSTGVIVNKGPSAFREVASFGFAFYGSGACGCGNELGKIGFGYRAFEAGEVTPD